MFVTNGPNAIAHEDADCICACCEQLHKPAKIVALPSLKIQQNANLVQKTADVKTDGTAITQPRSNVISIAAAIESAEQMRLKKLRRAKFHYPMLECF